MPQYIHLDRRRFLALVGAALPLATPLAAMARTMGVPRAADDPLLEAEEALDSTLAGFVSSYGPTGSGVPLNRKLRVIFVESSASGDAIDPGTVQILLNGTSVTAQPYWSERHGNSEFRVVPFPFWQAGKQYQVVIRSGVTYQSSGQQLEQDFTWIFQTDPMAIDELYHAQTTAALTSAELTAAHAGRSDRFTESNLVKDFQNPDSTLYDISRSIDPTDPEVKALAEKMIASLTPLGAVGLASPQFGINRRLFVASISGKRIAFLNPRVTSWSPDLYDGAQEGCLSIDGVRARVNRPLWIRVAYDVPGGNSVSDEYLQQDNAKVFLHEYDHLNGILMTDRQQDRRFGSTPNSTRQMLVPVTPERF